MNLKKEKRDETTASRHMSYLTILGTYTHCHLQAAV